jgi:hypothetical protein
MLAALLVCRIALGASGCTSMKTIRPALDPAAPPFAKIERGDTVVVHMRDGRQVRFVVEQVDGDALVARGGVRYTRGDMARMQRRSLSGWKTGLLVGGSVAAAMAVVVVIGVAQAFGQACC